MAVKMLGDQLRPSPDERMGGVARSGDRPQRRVAVLVGLVSLHPPYGWIFVLVVGWGERSEPTNTVSPHQTQAKIEPEKAVSNRMNSALQNQF